MFNGVHDRILEAFAQQDWAQRREEEVRIYMYADDIASVMAHRYPVVLQQAAHLMRKGAESTLGVWILEVCEPQCCYLILSLGGYIGNLFRLNSGLAPSVAL